jgi:Txe/YoeB family toxin of Txe-Axe toxin-antitoxin module
MSYKIDYSQKAEKDIAELNRLVYSIKENIVKVIVISAKGHYG